MEITLEKIELVKDRTGVGYKTAKEALEKTNGNVIDAIIYIEECEMEDDFIEKDTKTVIIDKIKDVISKGNVTRIQFRRNGKIILNIPVTVGAIGTVVFPFPALTAAVGAFVARCSIEIVKSDGEVVDINDLSGGKMDEFREKAGDVIMNIGEKAGDRFDDIRIKAEDMYANMKYRAEEKSGMHGEDDDICDMDCGNCDFDCEITEEDLRNINIEPDDEEEPGEAGVNTDEASEKSGEPEKPEEQITPEETEKKEEL